MTAEAWAIWGLVLWLISHDRLWFYERDGSKGNLWASLVIGVLSLFLLLRSLAAATGFWR